MGKLGARELNYSSDIDLVLIYDPGRHRPFADSLGSTFTRMARDLCALMEARDADGYVFRTDLRLRPDPAATPPAITLPAALAYYESMGENWERAAMIKARPVAGDRDLGARFLAEIRPFIWRRHLDFAAVADIRAMKRRMDTHHDTALADGADPVARIAGHDVKLGEGGIRGVEFAVQTMQLVWGGRDPGCAQPTTLAALQQLVAPATSPPPPRDDLAEAYRFLRRVEHRLQMVADRQTHTLPQPRRDGAVRPVHGLSECGGPSPPCCSPHLDRVRRHESACFDSRMPPTCRELTLDGCARAGIRRAGAGAGGGADLARRSCRGRSVRHGRAPCSRRCCRPAARAGGAARARCGVHPGRPPAQPAAGRGAAALAVPAAARAAGAGRGRAGRGALAGRPPGAGPGGAGGIAGAGGHRGRPGRLLRSQLGDARALDDAVAIVRRTVRGRSSGWRSRRWRAASTPTRAGLARTALADAALTALLPRVLADYESRYGVVRGGGMAVVLLGKAGGREMMAGSDLDLMLIYDHPADSTESDGRRRSPSSQYFIRPAHAVVAALTAPGAAGPLYAVDMRLRPSGNKGPVAVSLASFVRYHEADAWTWERMALTRARVRDRRSADLCERVQAAIAAAMATRAAPAAIRADATAMRVRMLRDLPRAGAVGREAAAGRADRGRVHRPGAVAVAP